MKPAIIAHRGHSKKYPENTLVAFKKALEEGADGIELDTHLTLDKQVVIHHYYTLGNTDNGTGYIFEKTSAYLRSLDCGSWFNKKYKNEPMPFLDEVFNDLKQKMHYEVELKDFGREYVDIVLNIVKTHDLLERVQFTSYQYPLLSYLKTREPKATVGLISQPIPQWMDKHIARQLVKSSLAEGKIDVIHCPVDLYTKQFVEELQAMKVRVHAGLADTEEQLRHAATIGADELTTNSLELAIKLLRSK